MNFFSDNESESIATIHEAIDAGVNFIDTANVYSAGQSETVVGKALRGRRDAVVLATKVHGQMGDDLINSRGNSRRHVKQQCEQSLRRLDTDYIDLYQLHRPDPSTPLEETLDALNDLVQQGKVHYIGFSTFPAWQTMEAVAYAERRGLASRPVCEQPPYNLLDRRAERELVPLALKHGIGLIPWSPLAGGLLTGKYSQARPQGTRFAGNPAADPQQSPAIAEGVANLAKVAEGAGITMMQLSLAWLAQQPAVSSPIIGPRDRAQLRGNLEATDVIIDADTLAAIDAICPPMEAVFPLA